MASLKRSSPLPGFGLSMGYPLFYLAVIVLIPLASVGSKTIGMGWDAFWVAVSNPRVVASYELSFGASLLAAAINVVFGLIFAWVLVRYRFPGKGLVDALIDLPFALPTAVAGIALATIYAENGPIGSLLKPHGIEVAYNPNGVLLALIFIGLPFVVRTVQPVLADLEKEVEEAAAGLGASRWQTFVKVILPHEFDLLPAHTPGKGLPARIQRVVSIGPMAQVELTRDDGELIDVSVLRDVLSASGLREGDHVSLRPRAIRVFQSDRLAA